VRRSREGHVMTLDQAVAFALFSVVMAGTPGPSNTLLTATGAQVGVLRGSSAVLGVAAGMAALMFIVTLGLGALIVSTPLLLTAFRFSGAAFLLYLAYQLATSATAHEGPSGVSAVRAVGFKGAAAFQVVNPKSWLACTSAAAAFSAENPLLHAVTLAVIFVIVALPSCAAWLVFGAVVQRILRSPRAQRRFNLAMAALLVVSVVLLFVT
jgi:threonine/homoserine/homoserine lactone efflux protein